MKSAETAKIGISVATIQQNLVFLLQLFDLTCLSGAEVHKV